MSPEPEFIDADGPQFVDAVGPAFVDRLGPSTLDADLAATKANRIERMGTSINPNAKGTPTNWGKPLDLAMHPEMLYQGLNRTIIETPARLARASADLSQKFSQKGRIAKLLMGNVDPKAYAQVKTGTTEWINANEAANQERTDSLKGLGVDPESVTGQVAGFTGGMQSALTEMALTGLKPGLSADRSAATLGGKMMKPFMVAKAGIDSTDTNLQNPNMSTKAALARGATSSLMTYGLLSVPGGDKIMNAAKAKGMGAAFEALNSEVPTIYKSMITLVASKVARGATLGAALAEADQLADKAFVDHKLPWTPDWAKAKRSMMEMLAWEVGLGVPGGRRNIKPKELGPSKIITEPVIDEPVDPPADLFKPKKAGAPLNNVANQLAAGATYNPRAKNFTEPEAPHGAFRPEGAVSLPRPKRQSPATKQSGTARIAGESPEEYYARVAGLENLGGKDLPKLGGETSTGTPESKPDTSVRVQTGPRKSTTFPDPDHAALHILGEAIVNDKFDNPDFNAQKTLNDLAQKTGQSPQDVLAQAQNYYNENTRQSKLKRNINASSILPEGVPNESGTLEKPAPEGVGQQPSGDQGPGAENGGREEPGQRGIEPTRENPTQGEERLVGALDSLAPAVREQFEADHRTILGRWNQSSQALDALETQARGMEQFAKQTAFSKLGGKGKGLEKATARILKASPEYVDLQQQITDAREDYQRGHEIYRSSLESLTEKYGLPKGSVDLSENPASLPREWVAPVEKPRVIKFKTDEGTTTVSLKHPESQLDLKAATQQHDTQKAALADQAMTSAERAAESKRLGEEFASQKHQIAINDVGRELGEIPEKPAAEPNPLHAEGWYEKFGTPDPKETVHQAVRRQVKALSLMPIEDVSAAYDKLPGTLGGRHLSGDLLMGLLPETGKNPLDSHGLGGDLFNTVLKNLLAHKLRMPPEPGESVDLFAGTPGSGKSDLSAREAEKGGPGFSVEAPGLGIGTIREILRSGRKANYHLVWAPMDVAIGRWFDRAHVERRALTPDRTANVMFDNLETYKKIYKDFKDNDSVKMFFDDNSGEPGKHRAYTGQEAAEKMASLDLRKTKHELRKEAGKAYLEYVQKRIKDGYPVDPAITAKILYYTLNNDPSSPSFNDVLQANTEAMTHARDTARDLHNPAPRSEPSGPAGTSPGRSPNGGVNEGGGPEVLPKESGPSPKTIPEGPSSPEGGPGKEARPSGEIADNLGLQQLYEAGTKKAKEALGLPETATDGDIVRAVGAKIGELGKTISATATKIMYKVKGMTRDLAKAIAEHLHDTFGGTRKGQLGMVSWHGSPSRFDKFSSEHIGEGEGAQAFGWGHYFASRKELAKSYRDNLTRRNGNLVTLDGEPVAGDSLLGRALEDALKNGRDVAVRNLKDNIKFNKDYAPSMADLYKLALDRLDKTDLSRAKLEKGHLYEVDIPEDNTMLDYDKPFNQQPEAVREAIRKTPMWQNMMKEQSEVNAETPNYLDRENRVPGRVIYDNIAYALEKKLGEGSEGDGGEAQKQASLYLKSIGITGIKYLDGTSRAAGEGSHNYVVFDDSAIKIKSVFADNLGLQQMYEAGMKKAKSALDLPPNATDGQVLRAVADRIGSLGKTVQETALKIASKIKGIARDLAEALAQHLHEATSGSRESQRGSIKPGDFLDDAKDVGTAIVKKVKETLKNRDLAQQLKEAVNARNSEKNIYAVKLADLREKALGKYTMMTPEARKYRNVKIERNADLANSGLTELHPIIATLGDGKKYYMWAKDGRVSMVMQAEVVDAIDAIERGQKVTGPVGEALGEYRKAYDELYKEIEKLGPDAQEQFKNFQMGDDPKAPAGKELGHVDNYLARYWETPSEAALGVGRHTVEGAKAFFKERKIPTFKEGILKLGLQPKFQDPFKAQAHKINEELTYIAGRKIFNEAVEIGAVVPIEKWVPEGMQRLQDPMFHGYAADPSTAGYLNNLVSKGILDNSNAKIRGTAQAINAFNQVILTGRFGLSMAHGTLTGFDAISDAINNIGLSAVEGRKINWAQLVNPMKTGGEFARQMKLPDINQDPIWKPLIAAYKEAGGNLGNDPILMPHWKESYIDAVREGRTAKAAMLAPLALLQKSSEPMMVYWVPRLKLWSFTMNATRTMQDPALMNDPIAMRKALQKITQTNDNFYGQLRYNTLGVNKLTRDLMALGIQSPGWNLGDLRAVYEAMADVKTIGKAIKNRSFDGAEPARFTRLLSYAVTSAIAGGILQKAMTGHFPDSLDPKDWFFPKTGRKLPNGQDERVFILGYSKDAYGMYDDLERHGTVLGILKYMAAKASPAVTMGYQIATKQQWNGKPVKGDVAGWMARSALPIPVTQAMTQSDRGTLTPGTAVRSFFGILNAPGHVVNTHAMNILSRSYDRFSKSFATLDEYKNKEDRRDAAAKLYNGNPSAFLDRIANGDSTVKELTDAIENSKLSALDRMLKIADWQDMKDAIPVAKPEEKATILAVMQGRVMRTYDSVLKGQVPPNKLEKMVNDLNDLNVSNETISKSKKDE